MKNLNNRSLENYYSEGLKIDSETQEKIKKLFLY